MALKINSGDLRQKVVFKQPTSSLNAQKEKTVSYTEQITTWAKVEKFSEYRTPEANVPVLIGSLDFYIRYSAERSAITKDWLIEYKGKDYVIHQIEPIDQDREMFIRFTAKAKE